MSLSNMWYDKEQTIILQEFEGKWTWEELAESAEEMALMMKQVNHPIYVIADISNSELPSMSSAIVKAKYIADGYPHNLNWSIEHRYMKSF